MGAGVHRKASLWGPGVFLRCFLSTLLGVEQRKVFMSKGQDGQVGLICCSDEEHTLTGLFFARRQLIDETSASPNTGTWQRAGHEGPWILGPWLRQPAQFSECFEIDYGGAVC